MSEEKCKYCGGEIGYIGMPYGFTCLNRNCITHNDKEFIQELQQQLQTAKEENEKLKNQNKLFKGTIKKFNLDWYGEELDTLTQQNKQMREALEEAKNYLTACEYGLDVKKLQNFIVQTLNEVNNEK